MSASATTGGGSVTVTLDGSNKAATMKLLPGTVGLLQATEAVKLVLEAGTPLAGRLLNFDALAMRFRETRLRPDRECAVCAPGREFPGYIDYARFCAGP